MSISTYYVLLQNYREKIVPNSVPPVLADLAIKDGYYRDLSARDSLVSEYIYPQAGAPPLIILTDTNKFGEEIILSQPLAGGAPVISSGFIGKQSYADDVTHTDLRPKNYTKSGWKFCDANGNVLAWPLWDDVLMFSTVPYSGIMPVQAITPVTPGDTATFAATTTLYATGAGNIKVTLANGSTLTFAALANTAYPIAAVQVFSTGTTATGILSW